jgi:hypothetical protein
MDDSDNRRNLHWYGNQRLSAAGILTIATGIEGLAVWAG